MSGGLRALPVLALLLAAALAAPAAAETVAARWGAGLPETARWGAGEAVLSFGRNVARTAPGRDGMLDLEYRDGRALVWGLKGGLALGLAAEGGGLVAASLRRDFVLGPVVVTAHAGPALYLPPGGYDRRALLQFRSGLDLALPLGGQGAVVAGIYHVSNGGLTEASADLDVLRLGLRLRF